MVDPRKILISTMAGLTADSFRDCEPPVPGLHAAHIPNIIVRTHENQIVQFYNDLISKRIVLIHCMSTRNEASCSHIEMLTQVQLLIGEDLGRNTFIYSITADPEHDTPAILRAFAKKYNARNGWLFLTGEPAELALLRERLFIHSAGQDCSTHLIRYGNEAVGLWGGVTADTKPESIQERLSWITPGEPPVGPPKRGGPFELV